MFYPKPEVRGDILEHMLRFQTFPLWTGTMLMERDVLLDCMPFAGMGEGDDLEIELARGTKFDYVNEYLVFYRRGITCCGPGRDALKNQAALLKSFAADIQKGRSPRHSRQKRLKLAAIRNRMA